MKKRKIIIRFEETTDSDGFVTYHINGRRVSEGEYYGKIDECDEIRTEKSTSKRGLFVSSNIGIIY